MNIDDLISLRRTIRKFKQLPIHSDLLKKYIDMARLAPSAANLQPLKFVVVQSRSMTEKMFPLVKWAGYLAPDYNPKDDERPVAYIAVCVDTKVRKSGYEMDVGAAAENIILSALSDGVGACWMGAIDRPEIKKLLNISENLELSCVIALGYPLENPCEAEVVDGNIKYYLDQTGTLCVPKRKLEDVLTKIL